MINYIFNVVDIVLKKLNLLQLIIIYFAIYLYINKICSF